ncbi:MAG: RICIN domain-containing protein [Tepidisphaeraceae bacterium]
MSTLTMADVSKPQAGESFQIESVPNPGQLLRVKDASNRDGTPMVLYPEQAWRCMTWELQADGEGGAVRLKNHFTHKTLAPTTAPADAAAPVVQKPVAKDPAPNEAWKFEPIDGKPGQFRIVYVETGLVLEAQDNGVIVGKKPSDAAGQTWKLLPKPERFTG